MVIGRIRVNRPELPGILDRAKLRDVEGSVRVQLDSQHVVNPDVGDHRAGHVRVLGEERPHQQAAVAAAFDGEFFRAGVTALDEVAGAAGKVVEDVLFAGQVAGQVPLLAIFAAAAQVGDGHHAAVVEPQPLGEIEARPHADAIAAVAGEQSWIGAIELGALAAKNIHRNLAAVLAHCKLAQGFDITEIHGRCVEQRCFR